MGVHSLTICLIVFPITLVNISVCVPELASPIGFVVSPLALVLRSIGPFLLAVPMALAIFHVALVNSLILEN